MGIHKHTVIPFLMAGFVLSGSLLVTAVLAVPQKQKDHPGNTAGDSVAAGKRIYDANSCSNCHAINGKGGKGGPNLSKVGSRRPREWLAAQVVNPKAHLASSTMPAYGNRIKGKDLTSLSAYLTSLKQ